MKRPKWMYSLRSRVVLMLLLNSLVPVLLIGGISYVAIVNLLSEKLQTSIRDNLRQVGYTIENELNKLNHVSMQLSFESGIGRDIEKYNSLPMDIYEKSQLEQSIQNYINLITYTSPNMGFKYYYTIDPRRSAFKQPDVRPGFNAAQLPRLTSFSGMTYNGFHRSMNPDSEALVLSVDRKIFLPGNESMHIFVETSPAVSSNIREGSLTSMQVAYLLVNDRHQIIYSEMPSLYPVGDRYAAGREAEEAGLQDVRGHYNFESRSEQGWTIAAIISKAEYNREMNSWIGKVTVIVLLSFAASLVLAWILWRTVYKPLVGIHKEIRTIENNGFSSSSPHYPGIAEFDFIVDRFQQMRQKIRGLITDVEQNEKKKAQLETEKLLLQINPHFIHNTLDSIRWIARLNEQDEIDRMISTLNKLLYYNMGKDGEATIRQELSALQDYVALQQVRYDFRFDFQIHEEEQLGDVVIPRFILQPLVENALYHGLKDDGSIVVRVSRETGFIRIEVRDNGAGMSQREIEEMFAREERSKKRGIGIGIHYVSRMLRVQYEGKARLLVQSEVGQGTSMIVLIPHPGEENGAC